MQTERQSQNQPRLSLRIDTRRARLWLRQKYYRRFDSLIQLEAAHGFKSSELPFKRRLDRRQPLIRQPASVNGRHITEYLNGSSTVLIRLPAGDYALCGNEGKSLQQSPSGTEHLIVAVVCHGCFSFLDPNLLRPRRRSVTCRRLEPPCEVVFQQHHPCVAYY